NTTGAAADNLIVPQYPQAEGVHKWVAFIRFIKIHLARDGGDAETIAIVCDPGHDTRKKAAVGSHGSCLRATSPLALLAFHLGRDRPEAERVQGAHRPGAHRKNVTNDPSDTSSCTLERLHRAGMIVRFNFERDGQPIADVDDAGVFLACAHEDAGRLRREAL